MKLILKIKFIILIVIMVSSCATYKNPIPGKGPYYTEQQLQTRFKYSVGIKKPEISDFKDIKHEWDRNF